MRAKLVAKPEDYVWSSYRQTVGLDPAPAWLDIATLHARFGRNLAAAQRGYRDFVMAKVDGQECLWDQAANGMYLGSDPWAKEMRALVESTPRSTDHPLLERAVGRPTILAILDAVSEVCGQSAETIRSTRGCEARALVAWVARNEGLITLRSIAAALLLRSEGHVSTLIHRCENEFDRSPSRVAELDRTMEILRPNQKTKV